MWGRHPLAAKNKQTGHTVQKGSRLRWLLASGSTVGLAEAILLGGGAPHVPGSPHPRVRSSPARFSPPQGKELTCPALPSWLGRDAAAATRADNTPPCGEGKGRRVGL